MSGVRAGQGAGPAGRPTHQLASSTPDEVDHVPTIADAEHEYFGEEALPEAEGLGALLLWTFGLVALVLVPVATSEGRRDLGWLLEPWTWPTVVLIVALLGGAILPLRLVALSHRPGFRDRALAAFEGMDRALVYGLAFLAYLAAVSFAGFTLSSIVFMQVLYRLSGLRGGKWPWIALAVTAAIVLAFRIGLGIWFPQPPLLDLLPAAVGNSLGAYL